jgi:hypothetical protein
VNVRVEIVRGDQVFLAHSASEPRDTPIEVPLDLAALEPGDGWQVLVIADDLINSRTALSAPFIVTPAPTASPEGWGTMAAFFYDNCAECHPGADPTNPRIPGVGWDFTRHEDVQFMRGEIWRKAVLLSEMPPPSATELNAGLPAPLGDTNRQRLAEWLAAGAPF